MTGTGAGGYSAASGFEISWITPAFRNGRIVRGRSFIVPASITSYDSNGTLSASCISTALAAAQAAITLQNATLVVYSRPTTANPTPAVSSVDQVQVPDKVVVLRSRRD